MPAKRTSGVKGVPKTKATAPHASIPAFLAQLDHPLKPVLEEVLAIIRDARVATSEGIKWNAPSFAGPHEQYFATLNVHTRGKGGPTVLLVLHRDVQAVAGTVTIHDPDGLLEWMGADRAVIRFGTLDEARSRRDALQAILREWVTQLRP